MKRWDLKMLWEIKEKKEMGMELSMKRISGY